LPYFPSFTIGKLSENYKDKISEETGAKATNSKKLNLSTPAFARMEPVKTEHSKI
jgi:hypothetical protein